MLKGQVIERAGTPFTEGSRSLVGNVSAVTSEHATRLERAGLRAEWPRLRQTTCILCHHHEGCCDARGGGQRDEDEVVGRDSGGSSWPAHAGPQAGGRDTGTRRRHR